MGEAAAQRVPPKQTGPACRAEPALGLTCDSEGGACGLGATGAGVLAGIFPAQVPQHQFHCAAPLTQLPALVRLQL